MKYSTKLFRSHHNRAVGRITVMLLAALALSFLFLTGCSSTLELTSRWTSHELKVDGSATEWVDATTSLSGPQVQVGVKNDKEYLYLCLQTSNRMTQMQMLALGTTVWFDVAGERNKTYGVQFPVAGLMQGRRMSQLSPEDFKRLIEAAQRQYEIVGPGEGERRRFSDRQDKGIDLHLGFADGTLTYELKVPLRKSAGSAFALEADPLKPLLIGLQTGDYSDAMRAQGSSGRSPGGSGGGGGRGGRGGGGQGGGGLGSDAPEPLKHWLKVHLTNPDKP